MLPVTLEVAGLAALVELELVFRLEAVVPRMVDAAVFSFEVILVVALCADIGALVVVRGVVHVDAAAGHGGDEALLIDAELHGLRIMAARAAEPLVVFDGRHDFVNRLRGVCPAALLVVDVVHVRAFARDAAAFLARQALRALEVLARIGMAARDVILQREFVALEVFEDLGLDVEIGVAAHAAAVAGRGWVGLVVLHVGLVFQGIRILVGFFAELLVRRDLGELDAVVIRRGADAHGDEPEEDEADGCEPCDDFLELTQL